MCTLRFLSDTSFLPQMSHNHVSLSLLVPPCNRNTGKLTEGVNPVASFCLDDVWKTTCRDHIWIGSGFCMLFSLHFAERYLRLPVLIQSDILSTKRHIEINDAWRKQASFISSVLRFLHEGSNRWKITFHYLYYLEIPRILPEQKLISFDFCIKWKRL